MSQNDDQIIEKYLNTMLDRIGDGQKETREVKEQITALKTEYEKEREAAKNAPPDKKKKFEGYQKSLAAALPGITKGTLAAVKAFQKSPPDIVVGSAAVVDICSSLASALAGAGALGGPPGALIGALFSTVSIILGFFAPSSQSLASQIEEMLQNLYAETTASKIKSAEEGVFVYQDTCDEFMKELPGGGVQDPVPLIDALDSFHLDDGPTIDNFRIVRDWLRNDNYWDLDAWPEILNLVCQVYTHLTLAVTRQNLYADDENRIKKYVGDPPDPEKEKEWKKLQGKVSLKLKHMQANNKIQRDFLKFILPVARKRGTFVLKVDWSWDAQRKVFAATGPKALQNAAWGPPIYEGRCDRMSVVPPLEGADHPNAIYDFWLLDHLNGVHWAIHSQLEVRSRKLITREGVGRRGMQRPWLDLWPMPKGANMYEIYAALDWAEGGALSAANWSPNAPDVLHWMDWKPPTGKRATWLRVINPSVTALPGDPDGPTVNDQTVFYAALKDKKGKREKDTNEIYFLQNNTGAVGRVTIPMKSYRGVAVDSYCVWIFGEEGLICATHASMQAYFLKKRAAPNWLGPPKNNKRSIVDVSVCGDGTILLCDGSELFNGLYRIDFAKANPQDRLTVEWERWADLRGASEIQKLPILGWPLLEASIQSLTKPAMDLVRPSFLLNEEPGSSEVQPGLEATA